MQLPFSMQEAPLTMKQAIERAGYGSWGRGRIPCPAGEVPANHLQPWEFDNLHEAVHQSAFIEWTLRCEQLKDVNIEDHIAKLTFEQPKEINYGQSRIIASFFDYEVDQWNQQRRCGTV